MVKIKGWKKSGKSLRGKMITYTNTRTMHQLDILHGQKDLWYVQVEKDKGFDVIVRQLGRFKTKKQALKFAKSWMKKHPRG